VCRKMRTAHGVCLLLFLQIVSARLQTAPTDSVAARFDDGSPAVAERVVGRGRVVHFAWMPGLSYGKSSSQVKDGLPAGFSNSLREWITWPVCLANVSRPATVNQPLVEALVLASPQGIAVTLLNWNGEPLPEVQVEVRTSQALGRVESVRHGTLNFQSANGRTRFVLPLGNADIVSLRSRCGPSATPRNEETRLLQSGLLARRKLPTDTPDASSRFPFGNRLSLSVSVCHSHHTGILARSSDPARLSSANFRRNR
jgi:hypothetical protein